MALSNIPAFPPRSDPSFPGYVDTFFTSTLPNFVQELDNTVVGFNNGSFTTTSTTSNTIDLTAAKNFTVGAGLSFVKGMWVTVMSQATADTNNYMVGIVRSYSGTALVFDAKAVGGSGTGITNWRISISPPVLGTTGIGTEVICNGVIGYGTTDLAVRQFNVPTKNNITGVTTTQLAAEGTVFTINTGGTFAISYYDTGSTFYISLNSAIRTAAPVASEILGRIPTGSTTLTRIITLAANDKIRPQGTPAVANQSTAMFSITRLA